MAKANSSHKARSVFVTRQVREGAWKRQVISADVVGLTRALTVFRAAKASNFISHEEHGDDETYCPSVWSDLAIGSGPCGLQCRQCFLMLTHRSMRDPACHVLYQNVEAFWRAARRWLTDPARLRSDSLGLGIDRSDSLLYEGVTGHARHLIPLFADPEANPKENRLILLTKSSNTHYLEGLPTRNVAVTFSLNPEPIADLWEGKWPDTGERITPPVEQRLKACLLAQQMGFEIRWRIDPVLFPRGWEIAYRDFFAQASGMGLRPRIVTLGTYREKTPQLRTWNDWWGLPPLEWEPPTMVKQGTHYRVPEAERLKVYRTVRTLCCKYVPTARIGACKETYSVRQALRLCKGVCNCVCEPMKRGEKRTSSRERR